MNEHGPLVFGLDPFGDLLVDWGLGDTADGLERFVDIVLEACVGTVGVVKPQSAFYERHGWRGMRSLARLVESCRESGVLVLLDAIDSARYCSHRKCLLCWCENNDFDIVIFPAREALSADARLSD